MLTNFFPWQNLWDTSDPLGHISQAPWPVSLASWSSPGRCCWSWCRASPRRRWATCPGTPGLLTSHSGLLERNRIKILSNLHLVLLWGAFMYFWLFVSCLDEVYFVWIKWANVVDIINMLNKFIVWPLKHTWEQFLSCLVSNAVFHLLLLLAHVPLMLDLVCWRARMNIFVVVRRGLT